MTMIPTPDIIVPDDLVTLADHQQPTDDDFTAAAELFGVDVLMPRVSVVYLCADCSCRFMPDTDGDGFYTDRFAHVGSEGTGCGGLCSCHTLPYRFYPLPGHCGECYSSLYDDGDGNISHFHRDLDKEHAPIHVVPVSEQDMDDFKQSLLRIEHDLTD